TMLGPWLLLLLSCGDALLGAGEWGPVGGTLGKSPTGWCSTWGDASSTFSVQLRRGPSGNISRVIVELGASVVTVQQGVISVKDEGVVSLPYTSHGLQMTPFGQSVRLVAKRLELELVVVWGPGAYLMVRTLAGWGLLLALPRPSRRTVLPDPQVLVEKKNVGRMCGLCGNFNGQRTDEFLSEDGKLLDPHKYAALQKLDDPNEICSYEAIPSPRGLQAGHAQTCSRLLTLVAPMCNVSKEPFLLSCQADMAACAQPGWYNCSCATLSEYSRQCSMAGQPVRPWRGPGLCSVGECPANQVYRECGEPCVRTCSNPQPSCSGFCTFGCFCPEGTVLDDSSKNHSCVPVPQCPCTRGGEVYAPGEATTAACQTCRCSGGRWECVEQPCPHRCALEGGSFVTTFDARPYRFHGTCTYTLLQSPQLPDGGALLAVYDKSGYSHSETSLAAVIYMSSQDKIVISRDEVITNNGDTKRLPYHTRNITVFRQTSTLIQMVSTFGLELEVQLSSVFQVYVTVGPQFRGQTRGLCGTFNGDTTDDFTTSMGIAEGTASLFVDSWRAGNCPAALERETDPCSMSHLNKVCAETHCAVLVKTGTVFEQCHATVDPKPFYKRCVYQACNYEETFPHICAALGSYALACASRGVLLQGWRSSVDNCTISCTGNQTFSYNSQACDRTCLSLSDRKVECHPSAVPVDGCNCPEGTYLNHKAECVRKAQCPCLLDDNKFLLAGQSTAVNGVICHCINGRLSCPARPLMLLATCSAPKTFQSCSQNSEDKFGAACAPTCQMLATGTPCVPTKCEPGCACPRGLYENASGQCVPPEECPCEYGGVSYPRGAELHADCKSCVCSRGTWTCQQSTRCPSTCTLYGEGHVVTFDGQRFVFDGSCEYILVTDGCGASDAQPTFKILTENVVCGNSGVTCSRAIKILSGVSLSIVLADGNYTVSGEDPGVRFRVKAGSLHLELDATIGSAYNLSLIWNKHMTVFIKVAGASQDTLCGLCGNYNGNMKDDFQTRSRYVASSELEFVNSWKESPLCGDTTFTLDPCSLNTFRQSWAERKCSIINSQTFAACHSQVYHLPYYEACVRDTCGCDTGGDCECLCDAVAAYAKACVDKGVCIDWRSPDFCPIYCDFYNTHAQVGGGEYQYTQEGNCTWHYQPCLCPSWPQSLPGTNIEGCYNCSRDEYFDPDKGTCVPCGKPCPACCPQPPAPKPTPLGCADSQTQGDSPALASRPSPHTHIHLQPQVSAQHSPTLPPPPRSPLAPQRHPLLCPSPARCPPPRPATDNHPHPDHQHPEPGQHNPNPTATVPPSPSPDHTGPTATPRTTSSPIHTRHRLRHANLPHSQRPNTVPPSLLHEKPTGTATPSTPVPVTGTVPTPTAPPLTTTLTLTTNTQSPASTTPIPRPPCHPPLHLTTPAPRPHHAPPAPPATTASTPTPLTHTATATVTGTHTPSTTPSTPTLPASTTSRVTAPPTGTPATTTTTHPTPSHSQTPPSHPPSSTEKPTAPPSPPRKHSHTPHAHGHGHRHGHTHPSTTPSTPTLPASTTSRVTAPPTGTPATTTTTHPTPSHSQTPPVTQSTPATASVTPTSRTVSAPTQSHPPSSTEKPTGTATPSTPVPVTGTVPTPTAPPLTTTLTLTTNTQSPASTTPIPTATVPPSPSPDHTGPTATPRTTSSPQPTTASTPTPLTHTATATVTGTHTPSTTPSTPLFLPPPPPASLLHPPEPRHDHHTHPTPSHSQTPPVTQSTPATASVTPTSRTVSAPTQSHPPSSTRSPLAPQRHPLLCPSPARCPPPRARPAQPQSPRPPCHPPLHLTTPAPRPHHAPPAPPAHHRKHSHTPHAHGHGHRHGHTHPFHHALHPHSSCLHHLPRHCSTHRNPRHDHHHPPNPITLPDPSRYPVHTRHRLRHANLPHSQRPNTVPPSLLHREAHWHRNAIHSCARHRHGAHPHGPATDNHPHPDHQHPEPGQHNPNPHGHRLPQPTTASTPTPLTHTATATVTGTHTPSTTPSTPTLPASTTSRVTAPPTGTPATTTTTHPTPSHSQTPPVTQSTPATASVTPTSRTVSAPTQSHPPSSTEKPTGTATPSTPVPVTGTVPTPTAPPLTTTLTLTTNTQSPASTTPIPTATVPPSPSPDHTGPTATPRTTSSPQPTTASTPTPLTHTATATVTGTHTPSTTPSTPTLPASTTSRVTAPPTGTPATTTTTHPTPSHSQTPPVTQSTPATASVTPTSRTVSAPTQSHPPSSTEKPTGTATPSTPVPVTGTVPTPTAPPLTTTLTLTTNTQSPASTTPIPTATVPPSPSPDHTGPTATPRTTSSPQPTTASTPTPLTHTATATVTGTHTPSTTPSTPTLPASTTSRVTAPPTGTPATTTTTHPTPSHSQTPPVTQSTPATASVTPTSRTVSAPTQSHPPSSTRSPLHRNAIHSCARHRHAHHRKHSHTPHAHGHGHRHGTHTLPPRPPPPLFLPPPPPASLLHPPEPRHDHHHPPNPITLPDPSRYPVHTRHRLRHANLPHSQRPNTVPPSLLHREAHWHRNAIHSCALRGGGHLPGVHSQRDNDPLRGRLCLLSQVSGQLRGSLSGPRPGAALSPRGPGRSRKDPPGHPHRTRGGPSSESGEGGTPDPGGPLILAPCRRLRSFNTDTLQVDTRCGCCYPVSSYEQQLVLPCADPGAQGQPLTLTLQVFLRCECSPQHCSG
uniref:Mucin 6, oligomeric mucus/gel-forming n=1 Tax=Sus scrofa TaxID=9823 RepID=A0A4X1VZC0_PIG